MSAKPKTRKSPVRRWLRRLFWAGVACLTAAALLHRVILREVVLPLAEDEAGAYLGLKVEAGDLAVDMYGTVTVSHLVASGPGHRTALESLSIERVSATISPLKLLAGGGRWLEAVRAEGLRAKLDLAKDPLFPGGGDGKAAGQEAGAQPEVALEALLPDVELRDARIVLTDGTHDLQLDGVDARLRSGRLSLRIGRAGGTWIAPRVEAIPGPVEVEARLAAADAGAQEILVETLRLGQKEMARDVRLAAKPGGGLEASGSLSGWGIDSAEVTLAGGVLEASVRATDASAADILRLVMEEVPVRASFSGEVRAKLPLERLGDLRLEADIEMNDVAVPAAGIRAEHVALRAAGRAGGRIDGDVLAVALGGPGIPPLDVRGTLRREAEGDGSRGVVQADLVLAISGVEASVAGRLRESDLYLEGGSVQLRGASLSQLRDVFDLPENRNLYLPLNVDVALRGRVTEPETLEAEGMVVSVPASAPRNEADLASPWDIAALRLSLHVADCELHVDDGLVSTGDGDLHFALKAGAGPPATVAFTRLDGSWAGAPFDAPLPPVLVRDGRGIRLEPSRLHLLGGSVELSVERDARGGISGHLIAGGLQLDRLPWGRGASIPVRGSVSAQIVASSSGRQDAFLPAAEGTIRLENGALTVGGSPLDGVDAEACFRLDGDTLRIERVEARRGTDTVVLDGSLPLHGLLAGGGAVGDRCRASFRADLADVGQLPLWGGAFRRVEGRVTAAGKATALLDGGLAAALGTADVQADVRLEGGSIRFHGGFPPILGFEGDVEMRGREIRLRQARGKLRGSLVEISGRAALPLALAAGGGAAVEDVDFHLRSRGLQLVRTDGLSARGDVAVRWWGPWDATRIDGVLDVTRAVYFQPVSLAPSGKVSLPLELFSFQGPPLEDARLNLRVKSARRITIRNNLVATRVSADLLLSGSGRYPVLTGFLSTDEGSVQVANTSLKIASAVIEFDASDPLNPRLEASIQQRIRGYDVSIAVSGRLDDPEVVLSSSPSLERDALVVLVMTGMTPAEVNEEGAQKVVATEAAKYLGRSLIQQLSGGDPTGKSFLDDFSVETESARRQGYEDPFRVEFRVGEDVFLPGDELFLQGERDTYSDYNLNIGIRFDLD